ncbi:MAG TPA: hypothetical protein VGC37_18890 [Friedmanniella sp.]
MTGFGYKLLGPDDPKPVGQLVDREALRHVHEQLGFLDASCERYDKGHPEEGKRLATTVRVLVYDRGRSHSLLARLGVKEAIPWPDAINEAQFAHVREQQAAGKVFAGSLLTVVKMPAGFHLDPSGVHYVPVSSVQPIGERLVPFDYWWNQPRLADTDGTQLSRQNIVLWLANKDGGAHVDNLPAAYERIATGSSMGVTLSAAKGTSPRDDNPIPASMRQIAEEVRWALRTNLAVHLHAHEHLESIGE